MSSKDTNEGFPEILRTGSMLERSTDLVEELPRQLGPYRILERIGEGGMGIVYLAEQAPPLVRRVAIKLARNAVPDGRALARFDSERQTLAVMNHPNIARVFDAGSAPDARPYFVMEHVAGEPFTEFCDTRRLGIEPRLELFLSICDGVQHAHVNAVIHRDLKPSNILVTAENGPATPKIIDFGVAKALGDGAAPEKGLTQFGQIVGTPEYMSPEQAALDGRPVDTRTDVYSLGVVLYELLVGSRPFERDRERDTSLVELCRRIREDEPERPSARAARARDANAAQARGLLPRALARRLRGDLDAIVLKALAKEPDLRYATPSALAADVASHLQHRPIGARRPGVLHRFRKSVRRHRAAWALSATLAGIAILGADQALKVQRGRDRAEADAKVANEVEDLLLAVMDPAGSLIPSVRRVGLVEKPDREMLLSQIRTRFADQPVLLSRFLTAAINLPTFIGSDRDFDTIRESRERIESLLGPDHPVTIDTDEIVGVWYADSGRFAKGEPLLMRVLDRRRRLDGADHPKTWLTMAKLADLYNGAGKYQQAAPLFEDAVAGLKRWRGSDDFDVLWATISLAGSYGELHRYRDVQVVLEGAIDAIRRVYGERGHRTRVALYNLACAHANIGNIDAALRYLSDAIERGWNYPFGPARDPSLLRLHGDPRFEALDRAGRLNDPGTWTPALYDAEEHVREGRFAVAESGLREVIAAIERVEGRAASDSAVHARWILAKCWIAQGRFGEAEGLLAPTLAAVHAENRGGSEWWTLALLSQCDLGRGRAESALARIATIETLLHPVYSNAELLYVQAEAKAIQGQEEAALELLAQASELGFAAAEWMDRDFAFATLRRKVEFQAIARSVRRRAGIRREP
jgi:non-specific serine/threonine protein kinase/serine/threonine-protein kinase